MPRLLKQLIVVGLLMLFPLLPSPAVADFAAQARPELVGSIGWPQETFAQSKRLQPAGVCGEHVQFTYRTGQPVENWQIRIVGTELQQLVNDTYGVAYIQLSDDNGRHDMEKIWWDDRGHPLNYTVGVSGARARIHIVIMNHDENYAGCRQTITLDHR